MSLFSKYRQHYTTPERLTPEQIQSRRTEALLTKERDRLEKLQAGFGRLSPASQKANQNHYNLINEHLVRVRELSEKVSSDRKSAEAKNRLVEETIRRSRAGRGFSNAAIAGALQRERAQRSKLTPAAWARAKASAAAGRKYVPGPQDFEHSEFNPRTVFGTEALSRVVPGLHSLGRRKFISKVIAVPCIERAVRKQVLFARGHAPGGHRVPHRPRQFSDIWC